MKFVEVTRDNFQVVLPTILNSISSAKFITFDAEFTGLCTSRFYRYSPLDEAEQRYSKIRDSAINFGLLQVGITAFHWNTKKSKYTFESFAFYVFPQQRNEPNSERRFTCQISSLEFLVEHNFDFNKTFYKGIPFMSRKEESSFRENNPPLKNTEDKPLRISAESKNFVEEQCTKIEQWMELGALGKLDLTPCNSFKRLLLYREVGKRFPRFAISKNENPASRQNKSGITNLSVVKLDENERNKGKEELIAEFEKKVQDSIGFRRVIDFIIDRRIPMIGHNCLMDLCHFFQKFIGPCPPKWSDFKSTLHELFPIVIDTKYIATHLLNLDDSKLEQLTDTMKSKKLPVTDIFSRQQEHFHDAGYDSLCTGIVFIGLMESLNKDLPGSLNERIDKVFHDEASPRIINRLHAMQSDYPYVSLDTDDVVPDRSRVLYFGPSPNFPIETVIPLSTDEIQGAIVQQLSPNGDTEIQIIWINSNSFFIIFESEGDIGKIDFENLKKLFIPDRMSDYQFLPYSQYSKMLSQNTNVKRCLE